MHSLPHTVKNQIKKKLPGEYSVFLFFSCVGCIKKQKKTSVMEGREGLDVCKEQREVIELDKREGEKGSIGMEKVDGEISSCDV